MRDDAGPAGGLTCGRQGAAGPPSGPGVGLDRVLCLAWRSTDFVLKKPLFAKLCVAFLFFFQVPNFTVMMLVMIRFVF